MSIRIWKLIWFWVGIFCHHFLITNIIYVSLKKKEQHFFKFWPGKAFNETILLNTYRRIRNKKFTYPVSTSRPAGSTQVYHQGHGSPVASVSAGALCHRRLCYHWSWVLRWCFPHGMFQDEHAHPHRRWTRLLSFQYHVFNVRSFLSKLQIMSKDFKVQDKCIFI